MEYYQLSASAFADKIGVQRSSISHLLSGRNKPSLDFVLKIVKEFKEIELYWLLNGKGEFPIVTAPILPNQSSLEFSSETPKRTTQTKEVISEFPTESSLKKKVERIVLFYTDGTFKEYLQ